MKKTNSIRFKCKYKFIKIIFLPLLFFLFTPFIDTSHSQEHETGKLANAKVIQAIERLYNWEFDSAETMFGEIINDNPDDPMGYFYYSMVTWSRLVSGYWTKDMVDQYGRRIDRAISIAKERIKKGEDDSQTYFYLGGALGFKGRFQVMEKKWISSFFLAVQAIDALNRCLEIDPDNRDVLFGLGIFDYYIAKFSGFLKFISYLLIHRGDKQEGLRKLHLASETATYSSVESKSLLIHIYLFLEKKHRIALSLSNELSLKFPENPRYLFFKGIAFIRLGMDDKYREVVDFFIRKKHSIENVEKSSIWTNRAKYLEACYLLFHNHYDEAILKLDDILNGVDPKIDPSMSVWPLFKKGMALDLKGEREQALNIYARILKMKNSAGAKYLTQKYIKKPVKKKDPFLGY